MNKYYGRKTLHMLLGIVLGLLIIYLRKRYVIAGLTGLICGGILIRLFLLKGFKFPLIEQFLTWFGRPKEVGIGAMYYFIGALIAILFFDRYYAGISVILLGVSDGLSAIIGVNSKHKIYHEKSFEGTMAFFVSSFLILYYNTSLFQAITISIILSLVELFSPVDDNIVIPPLCALLLNIFTW